MSRDLEARLRDMLEAAERIQRYVGNRGPAQLRADELVYDAVLRNLQVMGEAAKHVPADFRRANPGVEWRKIAGLRDIISHAYFGVDDDVVWDVVSNKIPPLVTALKTLVASSD